LGQQGGNSTHAASPAPEAGRADAGGGAAAVTGGLALIGALGLGVLRRAGVVATGCCGVPLRWGVFAR
jgi:hypothetical protein